MWIKRSCITYSPGQPPWAHILSIIVIINNQNLFKTQKKYRSCTQKKKKRNRPIKEPECKKKRQKTGLMEHQSYRDFKNKNFKFGKESSTPSKVCWFCSRQMHHMRQAGAAPQTSLLLRAPIKPLHDSNKAMTEYGMTQVIPTKQKRRSHNSLANGQWRRWSTDSPLHLHIEHQQ